MSRRPIVSYGGDNSLFCGLQASLVTSLPEETVEWRRSFGRNSRFVNIEVDFVPFSKEFLSKDPKKNVLQQPVFHTYWTECADVETYKSSVREGVQSWVSALRLNGINDWMVIVVGAPDTKKGNKLLPRTTVLDKMKADFGGKQAERCISLYEPVKTDSRSMESWQSLLAKMRSFVMVAYNRALNRFEDTMRSEREKRTEKSWSFCEYFSIQEELAEVMKLLKVLDESLVQYDELDALFTQFVLNSNAGDTPPWLEQFKQSCDRWEGLYLSTEPNKPLQQRIQSNDVTLLEMRNYLFQQQAALLLALNKPWELATRALSYLHNTVNELHILNISLAEEGGVSCWGFLSCMEVIHALAPYNQPNATHAHARYTAPLWAYARDKLQELGRLCHLLPSSLEASTGELHTVIALVCGMGNDPHTDDTKEVTDGQALSRKVGVGSASALPPSVVMGDHNQIEGGAHGVALLAEDNMTPMTRLKEALSSKDSFKKHYLEISEVSISTYKHIGHIRSARLIARDLAKFYLSSGQPQQATTFLTDLLNSFSDSSWPVLISDTRMKLQNCYKQMQDWPKLLKVSAELACCTSIEEEKRLSAFQEMMRATNEMGEGEPVVLSSQDTVEVTTLSVVSSSPITVGSDLTVTAKINSRLPKQICFDIIEVYLKLLSPEDSVTSSPASVGSVGGVMRKRSAVEGGKGDRKGGNKVMNRSNSTSSSEGSTVIKKSSCATITEENTSTDTDMLDISIKLDYKQDNSLASAALICNNTHLALSRRDSHSRLSSVTDNLSVIRDKTDLVLSAEMVELQPGETTITLTGQVCHKGTYTTSGARLKGPALQILQSNTSCGLVVDVVQQQPRIGLGRKGRDLIAGIWQPMLLTVTSGTSTIEQDTKVELRSSRGLFLSPKVTQLVDETKVEVETTNERGQATTNDDGTTTECGEATNERGPFHQDGGESDSDMVRELVVSLPAVLPMTTVTLELTVLALLGPQRDTNAVDHIMSISSPSLHHQRSDVDVHFSPPFCSSAKLHTAHKKKFFQVKMSGLVSECIEMREATLRLQQPSTPPTLLKEITTLNCQDEQMTVNNEQSCSYMWQLGIDYDMKSTPPLKLEFGVEYWTPNISPNIVRTYRCTFDLTDYKTVFTVKSKVEPSKGSEFCRAGTMCHQLIFVEMVGEKETDSSTPSRKLSGGGCGDNYNSIMYEVIADQNMWAVCGRTSGVLPVDLTKRRQHVTLDVMPLLGGFLPLPSIRLSKYIPADVKRSESNTVGTASNIPRLEPFSPGQVYNFSKGTQIHVLTASTSE